MGYTLGMNKNDPGCDCGNEDSPPTMAKIAAATKRRLAAKRSLRRGLAFVADILSAEEFQDTLWNGVQDVEYATGEVTEADVAKAIAYISRGAKVAVPFGMKEKT